MRDLTHFNEQRRARMVDVAEKPVTLRTAVAAGRVLVNEETFALLESGGTKKGDVLAVAQVAGIMGTTRTSDLIPMCHPLQLTNASVTFETDEEACAVTVFCTAVTEGKTGVEMEALTGASVALLTIYDMCKAIDRRMTITDVHLVTKSGGKSGDFSY